MFEIIDVFSTAQLEVCVVVDTTTGGAPSMDVSTVLVDASVFDV